MNFLTIELGNLLDFTLLAELYWQSFILSIVYQKIFDWHIDKVTLASQFVKVKEISELPITIKPFNQKNMEKFFLDLTKSLESEIFK